MKCFNPKPGILHSVQLAQPSLLCYPVFLVPERETNTFLQLSTKKGTDFDHKSCNTHSKRVKQHLKWTHLQFKVSPFVKEVESSCQTYKQQDHTDNGGDYLLLCYRLSDELHVTTAGAVEAHFTPETGETGELQRPLTDTHAHPCPLSL